MNLATTIATVGLLILLLLLMVPVAGAFAGSNVLPNIVVILTGDMGYGDIGSYGNTQIDTLHFDAIAWRGVLLTNGYAIPDARVTLVIYL